MPHPEDQDPENEFLKNEKKKDPMEFAKEYMEFATEYMNEMKEAKRRRDEERVAEAASDFIGAPVGVGLGRWRPPRPQITFTIQQIENGFVVLHAPASGMPPTTEYAPDQQGVASIVGRELQSFLAEATRPMGPGGVVHPFRTPPPEAGKGLPEGSSSGIPSVPWTPPKKAGEDPSSAGMTRVEGPPPVHEEPLGPLEP